MSEGWRCPTCGYVWGPYIPGCFNCNRPDHETTKVTDSVWFQPPPSTGDPPPSDPFNRQYTAKPTEYPPEGPFAPGSK